MDRKMTARKIAEESIVLLKNEGHLLPLDGKKPTAFFGRTQIGTLYSGNGSGGANVAGCGTILEECEKQGITAEPVLKGFYEYKTAQKPVTEEEEFDWTKVSEMVNSGIMYEIFGRYRAPLEEYEIPDQLVSQAVEKTDTAILVIGRNSGGEECDRHLTEDYYLTGSETQLVRKICRNFPNVILILNVNGLIDLSWVKNFPEIKSLLFFGIPGEEGAAALAKILSGEVNPSGKMAVTVAENYEDYPSAEHFSWDKDHPEKILDYSHYGLSAEENGSIGFEKSPVTLYQEDIYGGYRYFDTFRKNVLYPFGYGLSYTTFSIIADRIEKVETGVTVAVKVKNTGNRAGKEVVQIYLSKEEAGEKVPEHGLERPYQELKGFEKTAVLSPGRTETLKILIPWRELAVYDEGRAAWIIEKGGYILRAGNSSRDTSETGRLRVEETILLEQCENRLQMQECNRGKITFLSKKDLRGKKQQERAEEWKTGSALSENELAICPEDISKGINVAWGKTEEVRGQEMPQVSDLSDLSVEELAALCVGYGPGTPFAAVGDRSDPSTIFDREGNPLTANSHPTGYPGYVSPAIEKKGIRSVFYKDGPAGTGGLAWPTAMLMACSFDRKLWRLFGDAAGAECEEQKVNIWLAPAVNLHRNPLCGRNFEYFSEDPYLTGVCACEIAAGVQENHPVLVCPKHFAVNEQETFRRGSTGKNIDAADSILTERAARELYLKPFEMLVRDADIRCIMTSFNKINGVFAGENKDLCTHILREEWGFSGAVVTDWGDMDIVVDGADAVVAGNDIVMPGGPPVIRQILNGYKDGRVTREELEKAVTHLLAMIRKVEKKV